MKSRYIILLLLVSIFSVIVSVEIIDIFGFQTFRPIIEVGSSGNETVLSWQRLPYLVYYEIEVLSRFPSNDSVVSPAPTFRLMRFRTLQNQWIISQDFPFQTFWRVSAVGILRRCPIISPLMACIMIFPEKN